MSVITYLEFRVSQFFQFFWAKISFLDSPSGILEGKSCNLYTKNMLNSLARAGWIRCHWPVDGLCLDNEIPCSWRNFVVLKMWWLRWNPFERIFMVFLLWWLWLATHYLIKYYSPLGLVGFQQLWVVHVNYLSLGGPIKAILQRTDYDVINTCFCISLCTSPNLMVNLADHISQNGRWIPDLRPARFEPGP